MAYEADVSIQVLQVRITKLAKNNNNKAWMCF